MKINKERRLDSYFKGANALFVTTIVIMAAFLPFLIKIFFDAKIEWMYDADCWLEWNAQYSLFLWIFLQYILYLPFTLLAHSLHKRSDKLSPIYIATSRQWVKWVLTFILVPISAIVFYVSSWFVGTLGVNWDYFDFGDTVPKNEGALSVFYVFITVLCVLLSLCYTGRKSTVAKIAKVFPKKSRVSLGYKLYRYGSLAFIVLCFPVVGFVNSSFSKLSCTCDVKWSFLDSLYMIIGGVILFGLITVTLIGVILFYYGMTDKRNTRYILPGMAA